MHSSNKFTARHFIMIPFEDQNFINEYNNLCNKLKDVLGFEVKLSIIVEDENRSFTTLSCCIKSCF